MRSVPPVTRNRATEALDRRGDGRAGAIVRRDQVAVCPGVIVRCRVGSERRGIERDNKLREAKLAVAGPGHWVDAGYAEWDQRRTGRGTLEEHFNIAHQERGRVDWPVEGDVDADGLAGCLGEGDRSHRAADDSRPGGDDHGRVPDIERKSINRVGSRVVEALVEVTRPDRIDLAVEDGQPHLVAKAEGRVSLRITTRLVIGQRPEGFGLAGNGIYGRVWRVGVDLGTKGQAAVDAGRDIGRDPGVGGVVAGVAPIDDHGARRLIHGDFRLVLRPAGEFIAFGIGVFV